MPLLRNEGDLQRDAIYFHYPNYAWHRSNRLGGAIRAGRHKLIENFDDGSVELYDLQADPHETTNLINEPKHAELVKQLNSQLFDMLEATDGSNLPLLRDRGNVFPLRNPQRAKQAEFPAEFFAKPN